MTRTLAVIPAGGAGTRLWPRSRRSTPKHTLPLGGGGRPLLRDTYDRLRGLADEIFVVTESGQRDIIKSVIPELNAEHLIVEPTARGTTNAYGLAALTLAEHDPDAVMLAMAADHVVRGRARVAKAVKAAVHAATATDCLVLFGLKPTFASTGLGYVHASRRGPLGTYRVQRFVEKPNAATARRFLKAGGYYWNLAWFSWRIQSSSSSWSATLRAPGGLAQRSVAARLACGTRHGAAALYGRLPVEVVDRSVMEKTDRLLLVPADFDWADIGNWAELGDRVRADDRGNSVEGEATWSTRGAA